MRWLQVILPMMLLALVACDDNSCYDNGSALPLVRFYKSGTTQQVTLEGVTIRGVDAPGDSVLVDSSAVSEVYLPLRVSATSTQWVLEYDGETVLADTLTLKYRSVPYFSSAECGAMYNFELSSVTSTHYVIDSIAIAKPVIDNGTDVAIRLFFPVINEY